jgi:hypothetical protein
MGRPPRRPPAGSPDRDSAQVRAWSCGDDRDRSVRIRAGAHAFLRPFAIGRVNQHTGNGNAHRMLPGAARRQRTPYRSGSAPRRRNGANRRQPYRSLGLYQSQQSGGARAR